jgi:hypothetical protein
LNELVKRYWKNILMILLISLVIILIVCLNKANIRKDALQRQADNAFENSLGLALSGLNIDYIKSDEGDRTYFYSRIISGLGSAKELIPFTSYKDNNNLSYMLEVLSQFMIKNFSSDFEFESEIQLKIYKHLQEIMFNPRDEDAVNRLEKFIDSIE